MDAKLLEKYAAPAPRYTSYPTAPHFHEGVASKKQRAWIEAIGADSDLSLYVHIPFCDTLCWFCGCHTKMTKQHAPVASYLEVLNAEIENVSKLVPAHCKVQRLHWGRRVAKHPARAGNSGAG